MASDKQLEENLRLLTIFHDVLAGFFGLTVCMTILYAAFAWNMASSVVSQIDTYAYHEISERESAEEYEAVNQILARSLRSHMTFELLGTMFWIGMCFVTILSSYFIQQRQRRVFSIVIAAVNCIFFPFGTALGIFTIILLSKPEATDLYNAKL